MSASSPAPVCATRNGGRSIPLPGDRVDSTHPASPRRRPRDAKVFASAKCGEFALTCVKSRRLPGA